MTKEEREQLTMSRYQLEQYLTRLGGKSNLKNIPDNVTDEEVRKVLGKLLKTYFNSIKKS